MSPAPFEVIVTLPATCLSEVRAQLPPSVRAGADVAEIRFDRWSTDAWNEIPQLFPSTVPLLATYRSRAEGGEGSDEPSERARLLGLLGHYPFRYLDVERQRDARFLAQLPRPPGTPRPIVSSHLATGWSEDDLRAALRTDAREGAILKVVAPASASAMYAHLRPLLPPAPDASPTILLSTGGSGAILRALALKLGQAAVYAAPPLQDPDGPSTTPVEPAQIPVDAMVPFLRSRGSGRLFALLGHPVSHSLSPRIHDGWYAAQHRPALFVPVDIEPGEDLDRLVAELGHDGFEGFNVTHPWKATALTSASEASTDARAAGCANTLTRTARGWYADNFDVSAVSRRLKELQSEGAWDGGEVVILGAGGAARAAAVAASRLGARTSVVARSTPSARAIEREMGLERPKPTAGPVALIVQATPVGMAGTAGALSIAWTPLVGRRTFVLDMVYHPVYPLIEGTVRAKGGRYEDGSRLLVYQASECHRRWWGASPGGALESWALKEVMCVA